MGITHLTDIYNNLSNIESPSKTPPLISGDRNLTINEEAVHSKNSPHELTLLKQVACSLDKITSSGHQQQLLIENF
ncbi:MAG TPA: hypothetical protein DDW50_02500 [Firmicutes bacterium]|jgi:hypothetical protein|nr:hypothetical protein [Bacillota bacterium]